jgi:diguanylate cyclase (GGDEF)-like protein
MTAAFGGSRLRRIVAFGGALWLAAVVTSLATGVGGAVLQTVLAITAETAATVAVGLRALRPGRDRGAWCAFAAAMAMWLIGEVLRSIIYFEGARPSPSVPDLFYLGFYPPAYIGIVRLVRNRASAFRGSLWLDGGIGALAVAALGVTFLIAPLLELDGDDAIVMTNVVYPLSDIVLLSLLAVGFALTGWRPGRAWARLAAGLFLFAVADAWFVVLVTQGQFVSNGPGAVWMIALLVIAWAAWTPQPADQPALRLDGWRTLAVPLVFASVAIAVLVAEQFTHVPGAGAALATGTLVLVMLRTGLTFRENVTLLESRTQAVTDELTGLANRRHLLERLGAALTSPERAGLLIADLDRFKELNDTLGHQAGDRLLVELGARLAATAADDAGSVVARLGGDEFAVLIVDDPDEDALAAAAGAVIGALSAPFEIDGMLLHIGVSVGGALHPLHADEPFALMRRADVAMYGAKRSGSGYELYRAEDDAGSRERLQLAHDLRGAAAGGQFVLHYQPKASVPGGHVVGVEALIRWNHPQRGMIAPDAFLPIAEETGMMRDLTLWVIDESLRQMAEWDEQGVELQVAVNLAMTNLLDVRLPDDVGRLLDGSGTPACRLALEINENVVMADERRILEVLEDLRELGIELSLDDFGAGHTSFAYLKRLPIQELKIDRSFVMNIESEPDDAAIVRASTQLARDLGLRVVAEGVETPGGWALLEAAGVDIAQGYLLSRPLPAADLLDWVRLRQAAGRALDPHVA